MAPNSRVTQLRNPYKQAAIDCWTADPCAPVISPAEPGTRAYFEELLSARRRYAPWLASALGYSEATTGRILDVGCGQGIDLAHFALARARPVGIDLTPRHVELARAHLAALKLSADVLVADAENLPFENRTFDWVSSNGVLHHTPRIDAALLEIRRVLRPNGETRIVLYNRNSLHYWIGQVLMRGILQLRLLEGQSMATILADGVEHSRIGARPLVRVYSPKAVREMLRAAGFRRVRVQVRHLGSERVARLLDAMLGRERARRIIEHIGGIAGWYIAARGVA